MDRRGFDPADIDAGEGMLTEHATLPARGPAMLAARVVDAIDPDGTVPNDQLNADRRYCRSPATRTGVCRGLPAHRAVGAKLMRCWTAGETADRHGPGRSAGRGPMRGLTGSGCTTPSKTCATGYSAPQHCPTAGGTPATVIITIDADDLITAPATADLRRHPDAHRRRSAAWPTRPRSTGRP